MVVCLSSSIQKIAASQAGTPDRRYALPHAGRRYAPMRSCYQYLKLDRSRFANNRGIEPLFEAPEDIKWGAAFLFDHVSLTSDSHPSRSSVDR